MNVNVYAQNTVTINRNQANLVTIYLAFKPAVIALILRKCVLHFLILTDVEFIS